LLNHTPFILSVAFSGASFVLTTSSFPLIIYISSPILTDEYLYSIKSLSVSIHSTSYTGIRLLSYLYQWCSG
jgi:hypothetical protein